MISISKVLEIISTIIFFVAGIVTITKYSLKARVRMYLEAVFLVANSLWLFYCVLTDAGLYMLVAVMYIMLGVLGIFNFRKIYRKEMVKNERK